MASTINAITTGVGGVVTTADATGNLNIQNNGTTILAVTSSGVAVTGTLSATTITPAGVLPIANGGTNSTATATAGGVGYGTGTAHAYTSAGTSGQFLKSNGSSAPSWAAAGLSTAAVQTTGFTAVAGNIYPCNTTSAAFTVTLPASATAGDQIAFIDYLGTFATNNLTINTNGLKVKGSTINVTFSTNNESFTLVYVDSTRGWLYLSDTLAPPEVNVVKPVPPEAVFKVPDVGVTNKYPVDAGKVTVLVPATNGACNVIDPLVSPAMTIELI